MRNEVKFVLGLCVTGSTDYWALAAVTIYSIMNASDVKPDKVIIATDQDIIFESFKSFEVLIGCRLERINPRCIYKEIFPKMKGNYATYWKFDLFNSLKDNELLLYVDVDAFAVDDLKVKNVINTIVNGNAKIAAVPAQRPVIERQAATRINSPYDYFNAGVLFGVNDYRYGETEIKKGYLELSKFDTLNLIWHDQDLFNYLFRHDTFKLPYVYNVHTGYLSSRFSAPSLINSLALDDIKNHAMIAHLSGDYIFSKKYHPYKKKLSKLVFGVMDLINNSPLAKEQLWNEISILLGKIGSRVDDVGIDYWLQVFRIRKRAFASCFYNIPILNTIRFLKKRLPLRLMGGSCKV